MVRKPKVSVPQKISTRWVILGFVLTFLATALIAPYAQAWFTEALRPKPSVHFLQDRCAIVPLGGTNYIFCKTVIKNDGQEPATPLSLYIEVNSPYFVGNENKTYASFDMGGIRPLESLLQTFKVTNPTETVEHGSLTVHVRIEDHIAGTITLFQNHGKFLLNNCQTRE